MKTQWDGNLVLFLYSHMDVKVFFPRLHGGLFVSANEMKYLWDPFLRKHTSIYALALHFKNTSHPVPFDTSVYSEVLVGALFSLGEFHHVKFMTVYLEIDNNKTTDLASCMKQ